MKLIINKITSFFKNCYKKITTFKGKKGKKNYCIIIRANENHENLITNKFIIDDREIKLPFKEINISLSNIHVLDYAPNNHQNTIHSLKREIKSLKKYTNNCFIILILDIEKINHLSSKPTDLYLEQFKLFHRLADIYKTNTSIYIIANGSIKNISESYQINNLKIEIKNEDFKNLDGFADLILYKIDNCLEKLLNYNLDILNNEKHIKARIALFLLSSQFSKKKDSIKFLLKKNILTTRKSYNKLLSGIYFTVNYNLEDIITLFKDIICSSPKLKHKSLSYSIIFTTIKFIVKFKIIIISIFIITFFAICIYKTNGDIKKIINLVKKYRQENSSNLNRSYSREIYLLKLTAKAYKETRQIKFNLLTIVAYIKLENLISRLLKNQLKAFLLSRAIPQIRHIINNESSPGSIYLAIENYSYLNGQKTINNYNVILKPSMLWALYLIEFHGIYPNIATILGGLIKNIKLDESINNTLYKKARNKLFLKEEALISMKLLSLYSKIKFKITATQELYRKCQFIIKNCYLIKNIYPIYTYIGYKAHIIKKINQYLVK